MLLQALHAGRLADQAPFHFLAFGQGHAQAAVFQHQTAYLQGAAHAVEQGIAGEGLLEEVVGAGTHGLDRQGDVAVPGDQDHRQLRVLGMQLFQQLQAVDARHADIAHHHPRPVAREAGVQLPGIAQAGGAEAGEVEGLAQRLAQVRVIVDQQDLGIGCECGAARHARVSSWGVGITPGTPGNKCNCTRAPPSG